jgi:putative phosphonate metabolism protein
VTAGPRYAIYFVPGPETGLYRFGATVLGYDCYAGSALAYPHELGLDRADWEALTHEPRRYGFHATLKAPFHLSASCTEAQLSTALKSFVGLGRVVPVVSPAVRLLGDFIAIVPREPCPAVDALAADCVTLFDAYRAPMSAQERARRMASPLSPTQIANLDRWGYPYLFDEFRFHMTLTGRLGLQRRDAVLEVMRGAFTRECGDGRIAVDRIALVRQDRPDARFRVIGHVALRGSPAL